MNLIYGCVVAMCLSGGLLRVFIFSSSVVVQTKLGSLFSWCSHAFMPRLIVVISINSILGMGCCLIWFRCCAKCGKLLVAFA